MFKENDEIKVISGDFEGFNGKIIMVKEDNKVLVELWLSETDDIRILDAKDIELVKEDNYGREEKM